MRILGRRDEVPTMNVCAYRPDIKDGGTLDERGPARNLRVQIIFLRLRSLLGTDVDGRAVGDDTRALARLQILSISSQQLT
jgi:hypothetical protein